jgi:CBS domain-containing membrane protein
MAEDGYYGLHGRLHERFGTWGDALWSLVACAMAFLFFETPMAQNASPRSTIIGHFVAVVVGGISLAIFGLLYTPSVLEVGVSLARIGAAALSVAFTGAILLLLRSSHPPTGATVLIVSLGLFHTPHDMLGLMAGVVIVTVAGWLINRVLGVPVPVWSTKE